MKQTHPKVVIPFCDFNAIDFTSKKMMSSLQNHCTEVTTENDNFSLKSIIPKSSQKMTTTIQKKF